MTADRRLPQEEEIDRGQAAAAGRAWLHDLRDVKLHMQEGQCRGRLCGMAGIWNRTHITPEEGIQT